MPTVTLNPLVPPDTGESPGLGAGRIRDITQAIIDLFGLPANTAIQVPILTFAAVAPGNTAAANVAAIQAAHDNLPATGGVIAIRQYGIHVNDEISITKPVVIWGPGSSTHDATGTFTIIQDAINKKVWNVTGAGPFVLRDMSHSLAAGGNGVVLSGPAASLNGVQNAIIENCGFIGGHTQILIESAIFFRILACNFEAFTRCGVRIQNTNDADQGDSLIGNGCVFRTTAAASRFPILYNSGGGLKIIGNKILGGEAGIAVDPETSTTDPATISDFQIVGNSIEAFLSNGIFMTRTAGALTPSQFVISGNQIASAPVSGTKCGIRISPAAGTDAYSGLTITGNILRQLDIGMAFDGCSGVSVNGNYIDAAVAAFSVTATFEDSDLGYNFCLYPSPGPGGFIAGTPGGNVVFSGVQGQPMVAANLPAVGNGSTVWVSDAVGPNDGGYVVGNLVVTGGAGALAYRKGLAWRC